MANVTFSLRYASSKLLISLVSLEGTTQNDFWKRSNCDSLLVRLSTTPSLKAWSAASLPMFWNASTAMCFCSGRRRNGFERTPLQRSASRAINRSEIPPTVIACPFTAETRGAESKYLVGILPDKSRETSRTSWRRSDGSAAIHFVITLCHREPMFFVRLV